MSAGNTNQQIVRKSNMEIGLVDDKPRISSKRKRRLLDEDTFTETLEKIIERDFFPDLPKLKENLEYREALERNDISKLKELRSKFLSKTSHRVAPDSPSGFETPLVNPVASKSPTVVSEDENVEEPSLEENVKPNVDGLTLDSFLAKYNSEDNSSFEDIIEQAKKKHREKYPWLYIDESEQTKMIEHHLAVPAIENQCDDLNRPSTIATWRYRNMNTVMNFPEGAPLTGAELIENAKRQAVVHENTRFQTNPFNERLNSMVIAQCALAQVQENRGKIGVDGKELSSDAVNINGYNIVSMTPSPSPSVLNTPLMTWGAIESTPLRLDPEDTPLHAVTPGTPQFKIPAQPAREKIALSLSDKLCKQTQDKKLHALKQVTSSLTLSPSFSNSPRTPIERLSYMSPAAQRFAKAKLKLHASSDQKLRESYSPSPLRISSPSLRHTPLLTKSHQSRKSQSSSADGEVQRKQAVDFF